MTSEIEQFYKTLEHSTQAIEEGIDNMDGQKKIREDERKEFLLSELKKVLVSLSAKDMNASKELKGEAFDLLRSISKMRIELERLRESYHNSGQNSVNVKEQMESLKAKLRSLDINNFVKSLQISATLNSQSMPLAREMVSNSILIQSPLLSANLLCLIPPSTQSMGNSLNHLDLSIGLVDPGSVLFTTHMLRRVVVRTSCLQDGGAETQVEECLLVDRLEKKTAWMSGHECVTIRLRKPKNDQAVVRLSVSVYGSDIVHSPGLIYGCASSSSYKQRLDITMADLTLSDLDMTTNYNTSRMEMATTTAFSKLRSVPEHAQLNNSTPFSPLSEGAVSTMRCTAVAKLLSAALSSVHTDQADTSVQDADHLYRNTSVLTPNLPGQPVEEMQCSLSSSETEHVEMPGKVSPQSIRQWLGHQEDLEDINEYEEEKYDQNTSLLPETNLSPLEKSGWEVEAQDPYNLFNFQSGSLELAEVITGQPVVITMDSTLHCLTSPCCLAFLPSRSECLVTEPQHDRVGVYEMEKMKFQAWLEQPRMEGHKYNHPTAVLGLQNGLLMVVERDRIQIFNKGVQALQTISGRFYGLAEGPGGEVFTLKQDEENRVFIKQLERKGKKRGSRFEFTASIAVTVVHHFHNWATLSKVRFLMYSMGMVYISDLGLNKMYIIDMKTGQQTSAGYLGGDNGEIKRPTGLLADDLGNIMLADSDNDRLVVFTKSGRFVKVIRLEGGKFSAPHGLMRQGNTVLAVYMGREGQGGVVRYRVKQEKIRIKHAMLE